MNLKNDETNFECFIGAYMYRSLYLKNGGMSNAAEYNLCLVTPSMLSNSLLTKKFALDTLLRGNEVSLHLANAM